MTEDLRPDQVKSRWIFIRPKPNYLDEFAFSGNANPVSNTSYIFDGGLNDTPFIKNVTRLFDTKSETWTTISNKNRNLSNDAMYVQIFFFLLA